MASSGGADELIGSKKYVTKKEVSRLVKDRFEEYKNQVEELYKSLNKTKYELDDEIKKTRVNVLSQAQKW